MPEIGDTVWVCTDNGVRRGIVDAVKGERVAVLIGGERVKARRWDVYPYPGGRRDVIARIYREASAALAVIYGFAVDGEASDA